MVKMQQHDVFRYNGLGKSGLALWVWLKKQIRPVTVNEMLKAVNLNSRTIFKKIEVMRDCGLVSYDDGWQLIQDADLDKAAVFLGTAGTAKKQKEKHFKEREALQLYIKQINAKRKSVSEPDGKVGN